VGRNASAAPILPGEEPPPEPSPLSRHAKKGRAAEAGIDPEIFVAGSPVGEAQVTEGLLVGREVDENAVRAQQVVEQVSQLIEDDPDTAAALVKRWVESSRGGRLAGAAGRFDLRPGLRHAEWRVNRTMAKKSKPTNPEEDRGTGGLTKAAILLLAVGPDTATQILRKLDKETVEEITREVASLKDVDPEKRNAVVEEFYNLVLARQYVDSGGLEYARNLLEKSLPRDDAARIIEQIEHQVHQQPFSFLQKAESENLLTFIQEEHPQTIALILAHLPSAKASEILVGLPGPKQIEVVTRVANMEQTSPEVIKEVEKGLEQRLSGIVSQRFQKVGGVEAVAEMLNLADRATEKAIFESLESEDPDLVEQIRRLMFVFEDILLVNDKGIQAVLKEVDNDDLALALRTASEELKEKIFKNMSERAAQLIKEDMEYMGPVRVSDVETAQQKIVDVVRRLEDAGEIVIAGRGGEKELVV